MKITKECINEDGTPFSKEQFINRIKTDDQFAKTWGELGPVYGKQWRSWKKNDSFIVEDDVWKNNEGWCSLEDFNKDELYIDQIQNLINDLKTNPDSRRLMVSAWNTGEIDQMTLPPCHYGFQVWTRELSWKEQVQWVMKNTDVEWENLYIVEEIAKDSTPKRAISLMWNQRSVDTFLGLPFNIASYGLLLEIIAKIVNMVPDELIGNLGDVHLYSNHIDQAKLQISRELDLEERRIMVSQEMFNQIYNGGGPETLSHDECDQWDIPRIVQREPYPLPNLNINSGNENWHLLELDEIINSLDPDITFKIKNYQSHPAIKAPLSN